MCPVAPHFSLPDSVEKYIFRHNNDLHIQHLFQYYNKKIILTQTCTPNWHSESMFWTIQQTRWLNAWNLHATNDSWVEASSGGQWEDKSIYSHCCCWQYNYQERAMKILTTLLWFTFEHWCLVLKLDHPGGEVVSSFAFPLSSTACSKSAVNWQHGCKVTCINWDSL